MAEATGMLCSIPLGIEKTNSTQLRCSMIIQTKSGRSIDTATDLTAPERHMLQKLMIWESMASSLDEFREKRKLALLRGWNDSGPIQEREVIRTIMDEMEEKVASRLNNSHGHF
jgi:hypothetical protein